MRVLILGGDGYLGWPTAMHLSRQGHEVGVVDNYLRRKLARQTDSEALIDTPNLFEKSKRFESELGNLIQVFEGDCCDFSFLSNVFERFQPESLVHYAEQPSAPFSMIGFNEASQTLNNNLNSTLNVIWAVTKFCPNCHIIKLGTMGEYGTPNIEIEEGWIEIEKKGRKDTFLFPRQAGSLYHTSKILDTDLLWFYVRMYGLSVTDLMQGPVYGLITPETNLHSDLLPHFHYDDIFGTVVNRFLVQAIHGVPLTVFGKGGQTRGYLNLLDTLQCIELALDNPASKGELKIYNQFVEELSVNEIANRVVEAAVEIGLKTKKQHIENPRKESESHFYQPKHQALLELGLKPHYMTKEILVGMMGAILPHKDKIKSDRILPRVSWKPPR